MNFFLTDEQQNAIDAWLDEQNRNIIDSFINDPNYDEDLKNKLIENRELGLEIPPHTSEHGYYTISFTPTPFGNRIYVHHHVSNLSAKIFDISDNQISNSGLSLDDTSEISS